MKTERPVKNQKQLERRIRELRSDKVRLEENIIKRSGEVYDVITDPAPILKKAARNLAADRDFRSDVFNIALSMAANYVGKKVSGSSAARDATESLFDRIFSKKESSTDTEEQREGWLSKIVDLIRKKGE